MRHGQPAVGPVGADRRWRFRRRMVCGARHSTEHLSPLAEGGRAGRIRRRRKPEKLAPGHGCEDPRFRRGPTNLHRTYLTLNGQKADVGSVRKVMAGGIAKGSAIRLFEPGPVLGVAEGIETAFAASELFRVPVWSTINTTILSGWQPPEDVHQVIIFGDNDPKFGGQAAANALAHRLACSGLSVRIEIPPKVGEDWNDVLLAKRSISA